MRRRANGAVAASSAIAPSATPRSSKSTSATLMTLPIFGSRSRHAPTRASFSIPTSFTSWRRTKPCRCRRTMPPKWCRSIRWSASSACTMPASSIRVSAMPGRRAGLACGAGGTFARSAVHPRTRPDRRPAGVRKNAGAAGSALRQRHRLELSGARPQAVEALSLLRAGLAHGEARQLFPTSTHVADQIRKILVVFPPEERFSVAAVRGVRDT